MKKLLMLVAGLVPLTAFAQAPLLTILGNGSPQASDQVQAMRAGFLLCNPVAALPPSLLALGVRFADPTLKYAPGSMQTRATVVVKPQPVESDPIDGGGYRVAGGEYALKHPVAWGNGIQVTRVKQVTYFELEPGKPPVESVTLTFNVTADAAIRYLDSISGARVSARHGEQYASKALWFVSGPGSRQLTCYRKPDVTE